MPHASLKLIPGVDQNRTPALNEAAISSSNLIRFVPDRQGLGLPQKLGGWTQFVQGTQDSVTRSLHSWADTNGTSYLALGSEKSLTYSKGGNFVDPISPNLYLYNLPVDATTTAGSSLVEIFDTNSNVSSYDGINIITPISVGGLILSGYYPPVAVSDDVYQITAKNIIGIEELATSSVANGGVVPSFTSISNQINVTVTLPNHGLTAGSTFAVQIPTTVGGVTLYGNYIVLDTPVVTTDTFTISSPYAASASETVFMNDGQARIIYYVGQQNIAPPGGFGDGQFGFGGFGTGITSSGGRQFNIEQISTSLGVATVEILENVLVATGTQLTISGTTNYDGEYTVTAAQAGTSVSTFSFPIGNDYPTEISGTIVIKTWGFPPGVDGNLTGDAIQPLDVTDWSLDNWGGYLIANPAKNGIFYYDPLGGSDHAQIVPYAPSINEGCFVAMPERQIIAYGSTFNGIQDPLLVRWCDIGNFTNWIATVSNQAGSFRIPKGSKIVGGFQGPQQGLIWTDIGVWSMQYINLPLVYSFNEVGAGCGLVGRKAMGTLAGVVYWMSQSQFYMLSGNGVETVPCPIWDVIFQDIDTDQLENVRCAPNSRFGEISWYYPTIGSNGVPTKYVKFNTLLGQWDFGTLTRTAWIDQGVFGPPIGAGGDLTIYQHETSTDANGFEMDSYVQTGYFALDDGDSKTFIDQVWPDMKWGYYGGQNNATVQITFYVTDYPGQAPRVFGPYNISQATDYISPRIRGRLISIRITGSQIGSFWRMGNIRYRLQPDGKY